MQWENVYVFISSTFNDMHAERDYLVKKVFPRLSEWCEERKLRLIDIDLRWGVSEADATENKRVVQVCLERIDECRPFFLCFLGQRRGWVPKAEDISGETYEAFDRLKEGGYAGNASVTEMEILHALIDPLHRGLRRMDDGILKEFPVSEHAFFYLRNPDYLADIQNATVRSIYTNDAEDDPQTADMQLSRWREQVIPETGRPTCSYTAKWDSNGQTPEIAWPYSLPTTAPAGSESWKNALEKWRGQWAAVGVTTRDDGTIAESELEKAKAFNRELTAGRLTGFFANSEALSEVILKQLKQAITARFGERSHAAETPLQHELDQQAQFLHIAGEGFIGRGDAFAAMDDYLASDDRRPLAVVAPAGVGKTSLLARYTDTYQPDAAKKETLHYRFIGCSDGSVQVERLLRLLLLELQQQGKLESEIPAAAGQMMDAWPKLLAEAGRHGKIVLIIDALNQLETGLARLDWIPPTLPENVKMIVSFKRGDAEADAYYERISAEGKMRLLELEPFKDRADRKKIIDAYLKRYFKELDESNEDALIRMEGADNPLFLKTILAELRVFGSHQNLSATIRHRFGSTPISAFDAVLQRMEEDPAYTTVTNESAVPSLFGWVAHSRYGLRADELAALLMRNGIAADEESALDIVHQTFRQLRPYLARRDGRIDFFYESFLIAARQRYTGEHPGARPAAQWHRDLAEFFRSQPIDERHSLMESAYQLAHSGMGGELKQLLLSVEFMQNRLRLFDADALVEDYGFVEATGASLPDGDRATLSRLREILAISAAVLSAHKDQLASQLHGHLAGSGNPETERLLRDLDEWQSRNALPWLRPVTPIFARPADALVKSVLLDNIAYVLPTPDGNVILTVTGEEGKTYFSKPSSVTANLWDIYTGERIRSCPMRLQGEVRAVSPETQKMLVVATNQTRHDVSIYSTVNGTLLDQFQAPGFTQVRFLDEDRLIALSPPAVCPEPGRPSYCDRTLILSAHDGKVLHEIPAPDVNKRSRELFDALCRTAFWPLSFCRTQFTADGRHLVFCENRAPKETRIIKAEDQVEIWDLEKGCCEAVLKTGEISGFLMDEQESVIITAGVDGGLKRWSMATGELLGDEADRHVLRFRNHDRYGDMGQYANTFVMRDMAAKQNILEFQLGSEEAGYIFPSADGKRLAHAEGKTLNFWNLDAMRSGAQPDVGQTPMQSVTMSMGGSVITAGSTKRPGLELFEAQLGAHLARLAHTAPDSSYEVDAKYTIRMGEERVGIYDKNANYSNRMQVWDIKNRRLLFHLPGSVDLGMHLGVLCGAAASKDGRLVACIFERKDDPGQITGVKSALLVFDGKTGETLHVMPLENSVQYASVHLENLAGLLHVDERYTAIALPQYSVGDAQGSAKRSYTDLYVFDTQTAKLLFEKRIDRFVAVFQTTLQENFVVMSGTNNKFDAGAARREQSLLYILNLKTKDCPRMEMPGYGRPIRQVNIPPLTAFWAPEPENQNERAVIVQRMAGQQEDVTWHGFSGEVSEVCADGHSGITITGSKDYMIRCWKDDKCIAEYHMGSAKINGIAREGDTLAAACGNGLHILKLEGFSDTF